MSPRSTRLKPSTAGPPANFEDLAPTLKQQWVAARRNDASDADLRVLDRQLAERPVVTDWRHVDAAATLTAQCAAVRAG